MTVKERFPGELKLDRDHMNWAVAKLSELKGYRRDYVGHCKMVDEADEGIWVSVVLMAETNLRLATADVHALLYPST